MPDCGRLRADNRVFGVAHNTRLVNIEMPEPRLEAGCARLEGIEVFADHEFEPVVLVLFEI